MTTGRRAALVVNSFSSRNAGDAAIMESTIALARAAGIYDVTVATRYENDDRHFYADCDVEVVAAIVPFPQRGSSSDLSRGLVFVIGGLAAMLVAPLIRWQPTLGRRVARLCRMNGLAALADADVVLVGGGGYFYSAKRRLDLTLVHHASSVVIAACAGKRLVMMPQSIGPLTSRLDRQVVALALRYLVPVVLRERLSVAEVDRLALRQEPIICPDVAFLPSAPPDSDPAVAGHQPVVAVVVMDWTWARPVAPNALEEYEKKIATAIVALTAMGVTAKLLGHSQMPEQNQDDIGVANAIAARVAGSDAAVVATQPMVRPAATPSELRAEFRAASVVVGTRLHSCILALGEGTPAIALGYQPKARGTYELLQLNDLYLDVETFSPDELIERVASVLATSGAYQSRVHAAVHGARSAILETYRPLLGAVARQTLQCAS
jgi:colanic acid/amylovoran biosynthesis protein WcaK/AmsJ